MIMKEKIRLCFVVLLSVAVLSPRVAEAQQNPVPVQTLQEGERLHTIRQGETLYALTKLYNVTAEAICAANPGLSAANFKAGTVILIPKSMQAGAVKAEEKIVQETVNDHAQGLAGSDCREIHKVKSKETLFSIAQKYGVTLDELKAANPETQAADYKLKKKALLCIPFHREPVPVKAEVIPTDDELFRQARKTPAGLSSIKVGVILPLKEQSALSARTLDYYRGLLMAVDSLKKTGLSFEVYTFDAGKTAEDIQKVLARPIVPMLDVIFGPVDPTQIKAVSQVSKANRIPMVVPFYSRSAEVFGNPNLFVLNAPDTLQYAEAARLFKASFRAANVVLIETGQTADGMVPVIKRLVPSLRFGQLPMTENALFSRLDAAKDNVLVLSSSDMKSLNVLLPVLRNVIKQHPEVKVKLFGYPEWLSYSSALIDDFYMADTYIYTPFFLDYSSETYRYFSNKFHHNFNVEMLQATPRMAVYGFDSGMFFFQGLSRYGKAFSVQDLNCPGLQNSFKMRRVSTWGGLFNRQMQFVRFKPSHQIDIHRL